MVVHEINVYRKIKFTAALLILVFTIGTLGFHFIEGWTYFEAFFMTLITVSTIGYGELHPLSQLGRYFDVFIIMMGVGTVAYSFMAITQLIIDGEAQRLLGRRRLDSKISAMSNHYIICGNGRIGSLISQELQKSNKKFVIIDSKPEALAGQEDFPHLVGDATREELLEKAGIKQAKGLIATASSDVTNVYITLIAKELNPAIFVLARAENDYSIRNLKRAGADKVISPYIIGGRHMANIILKPTVMDFIELATGEGEFIFQMEGFKLQPQSELIGKTLKDSQIRQNLGLVIVAIKSPRDGMVFNPPADYRMAEEDVLVCIGEDDALAALARLAKG